MAWRKAPRAAEGSISPPAEQIARGGFFFAVPTLSPFREGVGRVRRLHRAADAVRAIFVGARTRTPMSDVRLSPGEAAALRTALSALVVKTRTGELGIVHGADRFVSTRLIFRRPELDALHAAARKLGLGGIGEHRG